MISTETNGLDMITRHAATIVCIIAFMVRAADARDETFTVHDPPLIHGEVDPSATASAPDNSRGLEPAALDKKADKALKELVEAFFGSDDARERARLSRSIEKAAAGSFSSAAGAMRHVNVWSPVAEPRGTIHIVSPSREGPSVAYRLPNGYDHAKRHPMIVCMPSEWGAAESVIDHAAAMLGMAARGFLFVSPDGAVGGAFHQTSMTAPGMPRFLRETRRRFHIDSDRVFLFGMGEGAGAAWVMAMMHPDLFAGVIAISGHPPLPFPRQLYPVLLPNLRNLPVLTVWDSEGDAVVAAHSRAIVQLAQAKALPIAGREIAGLGAAPAAAGGEQAARFDEEISTLLTHRRSETKRTLSHWFRYPRQGAIGWLRQTKFLGSVWQAEQLSVLPSAAADADTFITDTIKNMMAYLGGHVDGGTITIQARRCARVDLLLPIGMTDWNRPVTVICNGRKRYEGKLTPSISTMLEEAYDSWDFEHLVAVRFSLSIRADPRQN